MSEIKVNKISPRSGTTVTLGDSGDTFTIPAGATINNQGTATNFGATGSASWNTTVKTSGFTAVAGEGYFVNTTSGPISINLPAGTAGAVVAVKDYANTFDTNLVTLVQNGSDKIGGSTVNAILDVEGIAVTLVFVDSTQGWLVTDSGLQSESPTASFVTATGGTITTSGNFKIHTFTGPGTFAVSCAGNSAGSNKVDYLVVAGGGGAAYYYSGGGGGGGYRFSDGTASGCYAAGPGPLGASALPVPATSYPIVVGAGGVTTPDQPPYSAPTGTNGSNSSFSSIISAGGGGAAGAQPSSRSGLPGGSGGGAGGDGTGGSGGSGNTPPVSPPQGNNGNPNTTTAGGAGGGGAGGVGGSPNDKTAGVGLSSCISSPAVFRGGGGNGGPDGGEPVAEGRTDYACAGAVNTGAGAGGDAGAGNNGGSGIVIIRYKFQ